MGSAPAKLQIQTSLNFADEPQDLNQISQSGWGEREREENTLDLNLSASWQIQKSQEVDLNFTA